MINTEFQRLKKQAGWAIVSEDVIMGEFKLAYRTKITTVIQEDSHGCQRSVIFTDASRRCDQSITIAHYMPAPSLLASPINRNSFYQKDNMTQQRCREKHS